MRDILKDGGHLFLGSRLKRLGERMQADVLRVIERAGLPLQPSQYPILAAVDTSGELTVGDLVRQTGVSQPAVTRSLARLIELGFVEATRAHRDQRHKTITLTAAGREAIERSRRDVWPHVKSAVEELCAGQSGPLLSQIEHLEHALATKPLDQRCHAADTPELDSPGLSIRPFTDDLAADFHDINAQWIESMFALEHTDLDVLRNPRARIIDSGGDILFVHAEGVGIVGTCALQKTGERQFELTKMGVLDSARGRKAGEFLLRAVLRRAAELHADYLYLLTNAKCASAIHLYVKVGFTHDAGVMERFGARYARCDVAMRYLPRRAEAT